MSEERSLRDLVLSYERACTELRRAHWSADPGRIYKASARIDAARYRMFLAAHAAPATRTALDRSEEGQDHG